MSYQADNRVIVTNNLHARGLPSNDPYYYDFSIAGEGYPFDKLQLSSVWVGTPGYIIAQTRDKAWSYILLDDYMAWVPSNGIASVSEAFVERWQQTAKRHMAAITQTQTSLLDAKGRYQFDAYIGGVFPALSHTNEQIVLLIPIRDSKGAAQIKTAVVSKAQATLMPLSATREHMAMLIKNLINRAYGWGGMYFYNDCSLELKQLFTPLAIWMGRHSSHQAAAGHMIDKTDLDVDARLTYLSKHGHPLMTMVYIGGHIFLYLGNYAKDGQLFPLSYQNAWGLYPLDHSRRAVLGGSLLLPLLKQYPEDKTLASHAQRKYFQLIHLDEWPQV